MAMKDSNPVSPTTAAEVLGIPDAEWRKALFKFGRKLTRARKTCKHTRYKSFAAHGRCCPSCGKFLADFGD